MTGYTNYEVASYLLKVGLRGKVGCVFIDNAGDKMILMRGTTTPQLLSQCGVPWDKRFTFYDQVHTTGMDIKQDLQACAAITIGKDMTLRDFAQGAWRMRGLGKGQTLHIFVVGEMEKLLSEALGSRPLSPDKFAAHCVAFLVTNSCRLEQMQDGQLQIQNLGTCWRRQALTHILDKRGVGSVFCPSGVFVEDLDSTIPPIAPSPQTLDLVLQSMRDSRRVSSFLSTLGDGGKDVERAVDEIIAKAVTENAAVSSNDLDSEMESEREQEQEQEQEREQQAVSITARDKAEETPWPIEMLDTGMKPSASPILGLYPLSAFGVPNIGDGEGWTKDYHGPQTTLTLAPASKKTIEVFISDNVAVQTYNPQLHARRIKSVRMAVRWQDKSKRQFLGAVSLAEAAALRGRLHQSVRDGSQNLCQFEVLFATGMTVDCPPQFQRQDADADCFEQARSLLRFFNSDTYFDRRENIALVKGLANTPIAERALFYQGVTRCRRDAGVRWQTMPVAKAIRSHTVDVLEKTERISDKILAALHTKFGTDQAAAAEAFRQFDEDGNSMLSKDEITAAMKFLGVKVSAKEISLLCSSGDADKVRILTPVTGSS